MIMRQRPIRVNIAMLQIIVLIMLLSFNTALLAKQDKPSLIQAKVVPTSPIKKVLFMGNSFSFYNNGVHNHLGSLIRASGEWKVGENRLRLSTLSGGHVYEQLDTLNFLLDKAEGTWEAVVLQGHSNEPISTKKQSRFKKAITTAVEKVKAKKLQAILMMTWGYQGEANMAIDLANAYTSIANDLDVLVVPVGIAFWAAEQQLPQVNLFVPDVLGVENDSAGNASLTYRKDLKHSSTEGTYLMACVLYASLLQKSPEGNIFDAGIAPEVALQLQKLSWLVVQGFYKN